MDLGYYFSTPHLVTDLILKISKEKIGFVTNVDQRLFLEISLRGRYIFNGDCIPENDSTDKTLDEVLLDKNSHLSAMSHYSLACGHYKWLSDPFSLNFPDIATFKGKGP